MGIHAAISGITIIALGTSLPDTFASRTAALHDEYADAAIGNITGASPRRIYLNTSSKNDICCRKQQCERVFGLGTAVGDQVDVFVGRAQDVPS